MRFYQQFSYFIALLLISTTVAYGAPSFVAGKDYRELANATRTAAASLDPSMAQQHTVVEFFNYGCPACYRLESQLEAWIAKQPKSLTVQRIPVTFQPHWDTYAKAYYVADALGVTNKITPAMFTALHVQHSDLTTADALATLFAKYGVTKQQFNTLFQHSPTLALTVTTGDKLMQLYGINAVPTFVINNRYVTSVSMTQNPQKLFQVIHYLLQKT